jgi:hypothetical protein
MGATLDAIEERELSSGERHSVEQWVTPRDFSNPYRARKRGVQLDLNAIFPSSQFAWNHLVPVIRQPEEAAFLEEAWH